MNVDGGGGSRLKGPAGQPGQLNGMPSKKSQSTSKLSVKGEQGNYQPETGSLALVAPGPGETTGSVIISLLLTDGEGEDCDWVAPHQNTVSHVDPHAPLAGLPPGEGKASLLFLLLLLRVTSTTQCFSLPEGSSTFMENEGCLSFCQF